MKSLARTTAPLLALSLAFAAASAPALAAHRSISITNESSTAIHMQVISKTPDGVANVWSGMLDRPFGAHPNGAGVDQIIFSGHRCDISTEIDPHRIARTVTFKNCAVTVR